MRGVLSQSRVAAGLLISLIHRRYKRLDRYLAGVVNAETAQHAAKVRCS